jgi:hypothetical protein
MKFNSNAFLLIVLGSSSTTAFQLNSGRSFGSTKISKVVLKGYLDDLSKDLAAKAASEYDAATESLEATTLERSQVDRYGPSTLRDFKDFSDEFDGGDGQMGVAGDGQKGLEQIGSSPTLASSLGKSKMMSAKNAWGTSSGYADDLLQQNPAMDVARAQQLENWQNQREIYNKNQWVKQMEIADDTNQRNAEVDWRTLAKFGVERNQDFSLDEAFGAVAAGDKIEETVSMKSTIGRPAVHTINVRYFCRSNLYLSIFPFLFHLPSYHMPALTK